MPRDRVNLGVRIFLFGFILMFIGTLVTIIGLILEEPAASASYGGLILIGPIPIIIGAGPGGHLILPFLLLLFILILAALIIFRLAFGPKGGFHGIAENLR
jgi:uncharacterized membrane protein